MLHKNSSKNSPKLSHLGMWFFRVLPMIRPVWSITTAVFHNTWICFKNVPKHIFWKGPEYKMFELDCWALGPNLVVPICRYPEIIGVLGKFGLEKWAVGLQVQLSRDATAHLTMLFVPLKNGRNDDQPVSSRQLCQEDAGGSWVDLISLNICNKWF